MKVNKKSERIVQQLFSKLLKTDKNVRERLMKNDLGRAIKTESRANKPRLTPKLSHIVY